MLARMADLWLPPAVGEPAARRVAGNDSGVYMPLSTWCFLFHTTEGSSVAGAIGAYRANNSWPHLTYDPVLNDLVQHVPFNRPARSLRNKAGGVQTNRYRVIQIEVVGFAGKSHTWPAYVLDRLGRLLARVRALCPFDLVAPYPFLGQGDGLLTTETAKQRMSFTQWYRFRAICGHQHAPENTHWDPGRLDVAHIIATAKGTLPTPPNTKELRMDAEAKAAFAALNKRLDALDAKVDTRAVALRDKRDRKVWIITETGRWHVPDQETLNLLIFVGQVQHPGPKGVADAEPTWLDGIPIIEPSTVKA